MRTQNLAKLLVSSLVIVVFCAAAVVLTAQALSTGPTQRAAAEIVKASVTDAKPAQPGVRDRATALADVLAAPDSWKRSPTLIDF